MTRHPQPTAIRTYVVRCHNCGAWICRVPMWNGLEGIGECDRCGGTFVQFSEGRPFGPRSKHFPYLLHEWEEFQRLGMLNPDEPGAQDILKSVVLEKGAGDGR